MKLQDIIIEETEGWIAVNKPSGLLSIPDRAGKDISLKQLLQEKYQSVYTVHRLDRDTSGLIIFAKNEKAHQYLSAAFEERKTEKIYLGLVAGSLIEKKGIVDAPIAEHPAKNGLMVVHTKARPADRLINSGGGGLVGRGKPSQTDYEVLEDFGSYSWVKFQIHTGRTHQIRVHAKYIGHSIACDPLYGDGRPILLSSLKHKKFKLSKNEEEERPLLNRLALHAFQLSFTDANGKNIFLEAALPKDLRATINQLQKWSSR